MTKWLMEKIRVKFDQGYLAAIKYKIKYKNIKCYS